MREKQNIDVVAAYDAYKNDIYEMLLALKITNKVAIALMKRDEQRINDAFGSAKIPIITPQVVARMMVENYWNDLGNLYGQKKI